MTAAAETDDVLRVRGLDVTTGDGRPLVQDVDFTIRPGERVGLIGESGSGKSLTSLSLMGLLPEGLRATGSVRLAGVDHDLLGADEARMSRVRGKDMAMVFQEPMTALNPTMRIGRQIAEVLLVHRTRPDRASAQAAAVELLDQVGLPDPAAAARAYPHQFSGGQRQRVVLAIALANDPALLVCDEPTTALDVTVQARVLDLIVRGVKDRGSALLFITHDLAVVATACERVMVMYGGRIVESGPVREVFTNPRHRYTQGLIAASDLTAVDARGRLATIGGSVPPAGAFPEGCVFRNRCAKATDLCATRPAWTTTGPDSGYACFHPVPRGHGGVRDAGTPEHQEARHG
ncbi:ABC transporter ATP-binding protein [Streptomyces sp. BH104]|uniref:ABC transporter ATP-binding protein n=1 Tax=Streptomyces sp. BH104 TaxID=3410407 RepID=UPI003BB59805